MNTGREGVSPHDGIVREVDCYELRTSGGGIGHCWCGGLVDGRSTSVENPKCIIWSYVKGLYTDEGGLTIAAEWDVIDGT